MRYFSLSLVLLSLTYQYASAVLPDECFTPIQPCPNTLDQQFCQLAYYTVQMSATDCKRICIGQTSSGTQVNVNGQQQTVYCQAIFYKSPSTCKLYYQKSPGGSQGYLRLKSRSRQARQSYGGQQQAFGPPSQGQYGMRQNPYQQTQYRQVQQGGYQQRTYQQQGGNYGGQQQCECGALKIGCGKSGDGGANTTASPGTATTSAASCFQGPQKKELVGNSVQSYFKGEGGFDGTLATCQAACKALSGCKSLNFYVDGTDGPANCVLHDKTCASSPDSCADSTTAEYWDNTCSTRVRSKN